MMAGDSPAGILNPQALAEVQARIAAARAGSSNSAPRITLVAVTKAFPVQTLVSGYEGGLRIFGESRVQEAAAKLPRFPQRRECEVRLIGHLQSNKARKAVQLFDCIESVDSLKLLHRLDCIAEEEDKAGLPIYMQINAGHDEAKFGFDPDELLRLADEVAAVEQLRIAGIMTIAPLTADEQRLRDCFRTARQVRDAVQATIPTCVDLSMGMTDDFELAVEEGATHVRIGRALFGERP
ncbi:MAG: YggS family pyridoxal phosphate-dependent enzyme [Candidatus Neomarinimicrobiota bacterium]